MEHYDILIVGGGAAGISAAKAAKGTRVLLADCRESLGGVLRQCVHRGFGQDMDGPEYLRLLLEDLPSETELAMETTVLSVSKEKTALLSTAGKGRREISFSALILAAGSREITAGALPIAGTRPRGIYTAGCMQELMNLHGHVPGGPALILGSGDMGLIMAWQLAEKGIAVTVVEKEDHCGGLARNLRRLEKLPVRFVFNATVKAFRGGAVLEAAELSTGERIPCSTALIAAGLVPDRQLTEALGQPDWLFHCGNAQHIHPMIEGLIENSAQVGKAACDYLR